MRKKQGPVQTAVGPYGSLIPFESEPTKKQKSKKKKKKKKALNSTPFRLTVLMVPVKA